MVKDYAITEKYHDADLQWMKKKKVLTETLQMVTVGLPAIINLQQR